MTFEGEQFKREVEKAIISEKGEKKLIEKMHGFWSGSDIALKEKQIVEPDSLILSEVILKKENFPPVELDWGVFRRLSFSTRSRLAQAGIEIRMDYDQITPEIIDRVNSGEDIPVPVMIRNNGARPIEFEGGAVRFFWTTEQNRLMGRELREAISTDIKIEGEYGKDWFIAGADYGGENNEFVRSNMENEEFRNKTKEFMIVFPMKKKLYIPKDDKPLNIGNRKDLEDALEPVPEDEDCDLCLGETPRIELGENVCGVINTGAYGPGKRHLTSPLIDPGFKGVIRTELLNDVEYIELLIYRK